MDHVRENGEIYSNSVSKYFLNANFANNIILWISRLFRVFISSTNLFILGLL